MKFWSNSKNFPNTWRDPENLAGRVDVLLDLLDCQRDDRAHLDGLGQRVVEFRFDLAPELGLGRGGPEIIAELGLEREVLENLPQERVVVGRLRLRFRDQKSWIDKKNRRQKKTAKV